MALTDTCIYRREALATARTAFSHWQREPASPSFGCFDRQYWGWKKKDMPDATLQAGITLAVRLAEAEGGTASLPGLLDGYVSFLERIQHRDGSFDQVYPFERAPGVVHDILTPMIWLWRSGHLGAGAKRRLEGVMERGVAYALTADEKHGDIANHFAHYAWELIHYGRNFEHKAALDYGHRYLDRTLALLDRSEGWFLEYDGPDAGYQTRLLAFLARIAELTGDEQLWTAVGVGARFVDNLLMPDGSLHPMLGVRSTALLYPSSFERLARRDPAFAPLADRIHAGWEAARTPLPTTLDFENALRIADDAFEAHEARSARQSGKADGGAGEVRSGVREPLDLARAGLHRRSFSGTTGEREVLVGSRLGGPVVVYSKTRDNELPELEFESAGFLLRLTDGTSWVTRRAGTGTLETASPDSISVAATFSRSLHEDLTPAKLVALRILNLTVLRSQWVGDLFRKVVVQRLIAGHEALPIKCLRTVERSGDGLVVRTGFETPPELAKRLEGARLFHCRRTIANHMASSRYFQSQELAGTQPWIEELPITTLFGREHVQTVG